VRAEIIPGPGGSGWKEAFLHTRAARGIVIQASRLCAVRPDHAC
jgi:hypothetical protein